MHSPADVILSAYFRQKPPKDTLRNAIAAIGLWRHRSEFSLLQAAAGTVLLGTARRAFGPQELLDRDGLSAGRRRTQRWGAFRPKRIFTIEWGASVWGPLVADYFAVRVPAHKAMLVVLSAPTMEFVGDFDVALGHFPARASRVDSIGDVIVRHWAALRTLEFDRPVAVLREGLFTRGVASTWADGVWPEDGDA
jgi:hypothetical protein